MENWQATIHDFIEVTPLHWVLHSRRRWLAVASALLLALLLGAGSGWLIAEAGPLVMAILVLALVAVLLMVREIEVAYGAVIGVVTLLPFASLPFKIGFTPTFLDLALLGLFCVWLVPIIVGHEVDLVSTPLDGPVLAFMIMAVGAFVAGLSHATLDSYLIRHFAEILLSMALFYLIVNTVRDVDRLERLVRVFLLAAGAAATLGIVLYMIPNKLAIQVLSALGRLGYPVGPGVLRFVRDDPALMQRATSTSVDPNILGSLLNVALVMAVPQLFARRPILKRGLLLPLLGLIAICLGLTISRGSMVGAATAIIVLGVLRYPKILPWLVLAFLLVLLLPWTQEYVLHFLEGVRGEDLSTQMRFGEYKDAFILIRRYPVLGVGFAGAPDIDTYIGVSSVYLLIAEQMGLVGLTGFLTVVGGVLARFWLRWKPTQLLPRLGPLWYGLHAALFGGLVGGIFDYYFFSLDFHHSATIFWMIVGLATAATQLLDSTRPPATMSPTRS
ncbi:MAG: O-antigen ligase family protein [Chloroflexota bacterium]|nr:O-antigen ligase family protein [Chloroflexota bacterium]